MRIPASRLPFLRERRVGRRIQEETPRGVLLEENEFDGVGHGLIARIVRMQMIFRREAG